MYQVPSIIVVIILNLSSYRHTSTYAPKLASAVNEPLESQGDS